MKPLEKLIKLLAHDPKKPDELYLSNSPGGDVEGRVFSDVRTVIDEMIKRADGPETPDLHGARVFILTQMQVRIVDWIVDWDEHPHSGSTMDRWETQFNIADYSGLEAVIVKALMPALVYRERSKVEKERRRALDELAEKRANDLLDRED